MVLVRFDSGAMATAGDLRRTTMTYHGADGVVADTWRRNIDRFHDADTAELAAIRSGTPERVSGGTRQAWHICLRSCASASADVAVRLVLWERGRQDGRA